MRGPIDGRPTKRGALYVRVSGGKQEKHGSSIASQIEAGLAEFAKRGYRPEDVDIYREVFTGEDLWERPELTRLRDAIKGGAHALLIVDCIDRFTRDPIHLGIVLSEADHYGCAVEFTLEEYEDTPEGELIRFVRGYAAKIEHGKIKLRTHRGIMKRIEQGLPLSGPRVLYGYRWNAAGTGYEMDPTTGPIVRRIFDEAAGGVASRKIARDLTAAGVPTPTGKHREWDHTVIYKILINPRYTGYAVAHRYKATKVKGHTAGGRAKWRVTIRPEEEHKRLPDGAIPPLVAAGTTELVAARMARNKAAAGRNNREPEAYLLRGGYVRCGYTGHAMSGVRETNGRRVYRCAKANATKCWQSIDVELLDGIVWGRLEAVLADPERVATETAKRLERDPAEGDLQAVERQLQGVGRKADRLTRDLADEEDDFVRKQLRTELATLGGQLEALAAEKAKVEAYWAQRLESREQQRALVEWCARMRARLSTLDYAKKRLALEMFGVRVRVWRADHEPRYVIEADIDLGDGEIVLPTPTPWQHKISLRWSDRDAS